MNNQTKICQNCQRDFIIDAQDFEFYKKINVPAPTFCPECRLIRRMCFRNERSLYKRKCDATGKDIISIYSPDKPFKIYDQKYWWSDNWDPIDYGKNYDFNKTFFEQFGELMKDVPVKNLDSLKSIDSDYCEAITECKDCYLVINGYRAEDCLYTDTPILSNNCVDCEKIFKSDNLYQCINCNNSCNLIFSVYCDDCLDSVFLYDCRNCSNCFGCVSLRNKQYYIFNKPYSKENYKKEITKLNKGSYENLLQTQELFQSLKYKSPRRFAIIRKSIDVIGDNVQNAKSCYYCFDIRDGAENCKYLLLAGLGIKDSYDIFNGGVKSELGYDINGLTGSQKILFSNKINSSLNIFYSRDIYSSSNLFGCIGLRHKEYCILNKQYTKEEYEKLVPKIIEQMNELPYVSKSEIRSTKSETNSNDQNSKFQTREIVYRYGEFFPPELSPFCYNETIAQEYFPLTKEQALEKGYQWKDREERNIKIDIKTENLPDNIKDVDDSIIEKIIECANSISQINADIDADKRGYFSDISRKIPRSSVFSNCTEAFKIIPQELEFYRKMNLPLPRLCPNCRHYQRIKQRNPLKLWHRKCMCGGKTSYQPTAISSQQQIAGSRQPKAGIPGYQNTIEHFHGNQPCPNEFQTTYSPERSEIVYCEKCYLSEVV